MMPEIQIESNESIETAEEPEWISTKEFWLFDRSMKPVASELPCSYQLVSTTIDWIDKAISQGGLFASRNFRDARLILAWHANESLSRPYLKEFREWHTSFLSKLAGQAERPWSKSGRYAIKCGDVKLLVRVEFSICLTDSSFCETLTPHMEQNVDLNTTLIDLEKESFSSLDRASQDAVIEATSKFLSRLPAGRIAEVFKAARLSEPKLRRILDLVGGADLPLERMTGKELVDILVDELEMGIREIARGIGRPHTAVSKLRSGQQKQARPELAKQLIELIRQNSDSH